MKRLFFLLLMCFLFGSTESAQSIVPTHKTGAQNAPRSKNAQETIRISRIITGLLRQYKRSGNLYNLARAKVLAQRLAELG